MHSEALDSRSKIPSFLLLCCLFLSLYTLTFNGVFRLDDEHILAARTQSLALWGEFSEPQVYGNQRIQALIPLGDAATQIEPGQAVLGAVFTRIAQVFHLGGMQSLFSLNILLTSLCAGLVFLIVVELNYARRVAIWCAVLFGAGSIAWPYALTYFRDTLAMSLSTLAFLGWVRLHGENEDRRGLSLVLLGIGLLGGVLAKNNVVVLVPVLGCAAFVRWLRSPKTRAERLRVVLIALGVLVGVIGILAALSGEGPFARYTLDYYLFLAGHFWESININLLTAMVGPFLSPAKSVFLFSPPLLLGLVSLRRIVRARHREYTLLVLLFAGLLAGAQGLFYREKWAGDFGWGLKFMLPATPLLITLLAPVVDSMLTDHPIKGRKRLSLLFILSVVVQLCAVLVPWNLAYDRMHVSGLDPYASNAAWDVRLLAIPYQFPGLFSIGQWTVAWRRLFLNRAPSVLIVILSALFLAGLAFREIVCEKWLTNIPKRTLIVTAIVVFSIFSILTWWAAAGDPAWGDDRVAFHAALTKVAGEISQRDVVLLDSYGTTLWYYWMNRWDQPQRWYSLPFSIPGAVQMGDIGPDVADEVERLINDLSVSTDSLWYVTSSEMAEYATNTKLHFFKDQLFLDTCMQFRGEFLVDVCKFDFPN